MLELFIEYLNFVITKESSGLDSFLSIIPWVSPTLLSNQVLRQQLLWKVMCGFKLI